MIKSHYDIQPGDIVLVNERIPVTRYFAALNETLTTLEEYTHKFRVCAISVDFSGPFPMSYVRMDKVWDFNSWVDCPPYLQAHIFKGEEVIEVSEEPCDE